MFIEDYGKRLLCSTSGAYHPPNESDIVFNIALFESKRLRLNDVDFKPNAMYRLELLRSPFGNPRYSLCWIHRPHIYDYKISFSAGGVNYQFLPVDGADLIKIKAQPNDTIFEVFSMASNLNHIAKVLKIRDFEDVY